MLWKKGDAFDNNIRAQLGVMMNIHSEFDAIELIHSG